MSIRQALRSDEIKSYRRMAYISLKLKIILRTGTAKITPVKLPAPGLREPVK